MLIDARRKRLMTFEELLSAFKKMDLHITREVKADFLEVVIAKDHWVTIVGLLENYFGEPIKKEEDSPSVELDRLASPYGGVRRKQIMYHRWESNNCYSCALLWPWGCGYLVTLKLAYHDINKMPITAEPMHKKSWAARFFGLFSKE